MWKWLFDRVFSDENLDYLADKLLNRMLDLAQTSEFQTEALKLSDALYERYKAKIFSSIGGSVKGVNNEIESSVMPNLVSRSGKINWLQVAAYFLGRKGESSQQPTSTLP